MTVIKSCVLFSIKIIICAIIVHNFLPFATAITASIKSQVEGEGFHRLLKYYVDTKGFKNESCYIAIFVQLPSLLYTNVDELADLRRVHQSTACSDGEIDVELFAEKAYYQNVTICSRLTSTKTTLSVPIHQRYRFASVTGDPIYLAINHPKLLIGCKNRLKEHHISKIRICQPCIEYVKKWRDISYQWEGDGDFVWEIVAGHTARKFIVTSITMFVTLAGGAYVLWAIHKSFKIPKDRRTKEN